MLCLRVYRLHKQAKINHQTHVSTLIQLPSLLKATAAPAVPWLSLNVTIVDNDRGDSQSSNSRARLGLVLKRRLKLLLGCMQGGRHCLARAVERQRVRSHDPVLGRWLGLTPEQPPASILPEGLPRVPQGSPESGW